MRSVELRVIITTSDSSDNAADRIETNVRRALHREYDAALCYVEGVTPKP